MEYQERMRQEMADPIHDIIECSLKQEKSIKYGKRADIMPIYKIFKKKNHLIIDQNSL